MASDVMSNPFARYDGDHIDKPVTSSIYSMSTCMILPIAVFHIENVLTKPENVDMDWLLCQIVSETLQNKKTYTIVITASMDEGGFISRCDDIHANSQGKTCGEIIENMKDVIELTAKTFDWVHSITARCKCSKADLVNICDPVTRIIREYYLNYRHIPLYSKYFNKV